MSSVDDLVIGSASFVIMYSLLKKEEKKNEGAGVGGWLRRLKVE